MQPTRCLSSPRNVRGRPVLRQRFKRFEDAVNAILTAAFLNASEQASLDVCDFIFHEIVRFVVAEPAVVL